MTQSKHSPLPWSVEQSTARVEIKMKGKSIALPHSALADARLIVTAVNNHAKLVEALKQTLRCLEWHNGEHGVASDAYVVESARAVLKESGVEL